MSKCWNGKGNQAIIYWLKKQGKTKSDLGRILRYTPTALHKRINDPHLFTLGELLQLAGAFGVTVEVLVYCIERNKPKVKSKQDKWFLQDVMEKGDKISDSI
jgi:helix-turn-helix protein